jgi:hypothetical protein
VSHIHYCNRKQNAASSFSQLHTNLHTSFAAHSLTHLKEISIVKINKNETYNNNIG